MASIAYADVRSRELQPIDARDICTKVTLVIAGRPSGREMERAHVLDGSNTAYTHYPVPISVTVEADEHATYHAHKVFQLPDGTNPFLDPTDPIIPDPSAYGVEDASVLRDGDPDTSVTIPIDGTFYANASSMALVSVRNSASHGDEPRLVGWRIMYSLHVSAEHEATALREPFIWSDLWVEFGPPIIATRYFWDLPYTPGQADVTDLWATAHVDARSNLSATQTLDRFYVSIYGVLGQLVVTHFYPLVLNTPYLEAIARSHLRLPASTPSRVTVAGVVPLEDEHTIVGWPGGDLVISVARQTYARDETIIEVEQKSAPRGLAASTAEAASIRRQREELARTTDLYGLRMAPR